MLGTLAHPVSHTENEFVHAALCHAVPPGQLGYVATVGMDCWRRSRARLHTFCRLYPVRCRFIPPCSACFAVFPCMWLVQFGFHTGITAPYPRKYRNSPVVSLAQIEGQDADVSG